MLPTVYAGIAAEMMFDGGRREGSSLDEIAECQMICTIAAPKLNTEGATIYTRIHWAVGSILDRYARQHAELTAAVLRNLTLRSRQLRFLTCNIKNHRREFLAGVSGDS